MSITTKDNTNKTRHKIFSYTFCKLYLYFFQSNWLHKTNWTALEV